MALCPALGLYSTLYQEAVPCDELNKAQAQQLSLLAPTMDRTRACSRLQVLLGHLGRPSGPAIVSFGLWMGSQAGRSYLHPGGDSKGAREPLRHCLFPVPSPRGSRVEAAPTRKPLSSARATGVTL